MFNTLESTPLKLQSFIHVIAQSGRVVEFEKQKQAIESIGKYPALHECLLEWLIILGKQNVVWKKKLLGVTGNLKNVTIIKMNLKTLFHGKYSQTDKQELHKLIADGIKSGTVQPLPTNVYTSEKDLEQAFK